MILPGSPQLFAARALLFATPAATAPDRRRHQLAAGPPPPAAAGSTSTSEHDASPARLNDPSRNPGLRPSHSATSITAKVASWTAAVTTSPHSRASTATSVTGGAGDTSDTVTALSEGTTRSSGRSVGSAGGGGLGRLFAGRNGNRANAIRHIGNGSAAPSAVLAAGPDLPSGERLPPTNEGEQWIEQLCHACGQNEDSDTVVANLMAGGLSRDFLANDMINYIHIIELDLTWTQPSDFDDSSHFQKWKHFHRAETARLLSSIDTTFEAVQHTVDDELITLRVEQASGLLAKDKLGSSNPYAIVTMGGRHFFQSPVAQRTQNPTFNLQVSLLIRSHSDSATISLWNRSSESPSRLFRGGGHDRFLGLCTLTSSELLRDAESGPTQKWIPLEKRTSNSNVAGKVLVAVEKTIKKENASPLAIFQIAFHCIPSDPLNSFKSLLMDCCPNTKKKDGVLPLLNRRVDDMLTEIASLWRIDSTLQALIKLDVLASVFARGDISGKQLCEGSFFDALDRVNAASREGLLSTTAIFIFKVAGALLFDTIYQQFSSFFGQPAESLDTSAAEELRFKSLIIEPLSGHPLLPERIRVTGIQSEESSATKNPSIASLTQDLIARSLSGRFHGLSAIALTRAMRESEEENSVLAVAGIKNVKPNSRREEQTLPPLPVASASPGNGAVLLLLLQQVCEELEALGANFDMLLFGRLHVPTIAARVYLDHLLPKLENFARTYANSTSDLEEAFALYHQARELERVYDQIDHRLLHDFEINAWFRPFVSDWLDLAERKEMEWVQNAIKADEFSSIENGHSSSVLDIFTSFQQQLEFLLKLNWPDEKEFQFFILRFLEGVTAAVEKYVFLIRRAFHSDLSKPTVMAKAPTRINGQHFRLKLRRFGPPIDASELRVPATAIVRLSDVDAVLTRYNELIGRLPPVFRQPISAARSNASPRQGSNPQASSGSTSSLIPRRSASSASPPASLRTPVSLSILYASDLPVVRPFSTLVSVHVASPASPVQPNLELGRTRETHQPHLAFALPRSAKELEKGTDAPLEYEHDDPAVIPALLSDREVQTGLSVSLVHRVLPVVPGEPGGDAGGGEFVVATASLNLAAAVTASAQATAEEPSLRLSLNFQQQEETEAVAVRIGGGTVHIKVSIHRRQSCEIMQRRIRYVVRETVLEMAKELVNKIRFVKTFDPALRTFLRTKRSR
ncbi:hypothetical protein DFJ73DRAFT_232570 [Zopfochytrium polystomum]|nr:hypothetical protein DFJ73DRAFT_232570 [Zopfochytrium polystomum]